MGRLTAAGAVLLVLAVVARTLSDPAVLFFVSSPDAPWIRVDRPFTPQPFGDAIMGSDFRKQFVLDRPVADLTIQVAVPHKGRVILDEKEILSWTANRGDWRKPKTVVLGNLAAGPHELIVVSLNERGPNAISVACESLPLSTAAGWEGTELESRWKPAVRVEERPSSDTASRFPSSLEALQARWPWLLAVALGAAAGLFWFARRAKKPEAWDAAAFARVLPGRIRIAALAAFGVVALNNLARGWVGDGFDYYGHTDYVTFILERGALPLAPDGIQMFQSPLYYMLGAVLVKGLSLFMAAESALRWLVLINLACGLAQIEICWRAIKIVLPDRPWAQSLGMLVGGFLPMNVYFSHYVGNQSLEGALTALAIMLALKHLAAEEWANGKQLSLLGLVLGLALLSKVNAIVPAVLIVTVLMVRSTIAQRSAWLTCEDLLFLVGPIVAVASWYYFRNWLTFGRPFIGGWDAAAAYKWWQDRGFNTPGDLWTIGPGITHPVHSAFGSVWDGFYSSMWLDAHLGGGDFDGRPRWNDGFLVSSALVGLVPTFGMLMGLGLPFVRRTESRVPLLFVSVTTVTLLGAYLAYNLRNPCFASGKAFYVIGGLPCFAILAGLGLETFARVRWLWPIVLGVVACVPVWTVASYLIVQ